jgi:hypothetical protein
MIKTFPGLRTLFIDGSIRILLLVAFLTLPIRISSLIKLSAGIRLNL